MFEIIEKGAAPVLVVAINRFIRRFLRRRTISSRTSSDGT